MSGECQLPFDPFAIFRRAAAVLTSSLELEQALANTIAACLPELGDFGFFDVVLDNDVRRTARAHQNPALEALLNTTRWQRSQRADMNLCALSSGEPVLYTNTDDAWFERAFNAPRTLGFRSMLSVPVRCGDELIGSLTLFMGDSGRHHNEAHFRFAADLAGLAAPIVVNARLLERQQQSQAELRRSEERLRIATNAAKIGVWDWDIPADRLTWSDRVYEMYGLTRERFGATASEFAAMVHPEDRAQVNGKIAAALAGGDFYSVEFRIIRPDGSQRWLSSWAHIDRDPAGHALRMVGSTIDITEQKYLETGLSFRNAQLEKEVVSSTSERDRIWRMSQDILAVISCDGYLMSASPAVARILGWDEGEVAEIPLVDLVRTEQRGLLQERLTALLGGELAGDIELQFRRKAGDFRWIAWTFVAEQGVIYGVGRDITELRRQRETLLSLTERRLQLALDTGGMAAWLWDINNGRVSWLPGMDELHGLPPGSGIEKAEDYLQFVHPEDHAKVSQSVDNPRQFRMDEGIEYRILLPDGSTRWLEGRSEIYRDDAGKPAYKAGICVDITRRKRTEQNLRFLASASAELADLVDHEITLRRVAQVAVPLFADWCAVDLLDSQGVLQRVAVAHVDQAKVHLAHTLKNRYPPNPDAPQGAWNIIRTGQSELIPEITDDVLRTSIKDAEQLDIIRELGLRSYIGAPLAVRGKILGTITLVSAESRRVYTWDDVALVEDIASRAAVAIENSYLYQSLKEADRRKDDFLAMLAHELRNPLAPIRMAADLLARPLSEAQLHSTSQVISRQVQHMTGLVDDLLDVSRVTRGRIAIEKQPIEIQSVVQAAIEQVRPLIQMHSHRLSVSTHAEPLFVAGDEKRLVQILANLLNNAAKYTPDAGLIELTVHLRGEMVAIAVTDNGIGMTPELLDSAFELFVQGKRTADRSQGGLGLGLALVKTLVELHQGQVSAFSRGLHCGSTFTVHLPRYCQIPTDLRKPDSAEAAPAHSLRILVVDDNVDAAETLGMLLRAVGHQAQIVYTSTEALDRAHERAYDLILLDIGLPDMDGYELARRLRQSLAQPPVLAAISGYGRQEDQNSAREAGIDRYFVKPLDTQKLLAFLQTVGRRDASLSAIADGASAIVNSASVVEELRWDESSEPI